MEYKVGIDYYDEKNENEFSHQYYYFTIGIIRCGIE
jgi:hypothetical protein